MRKRSERWRESESGKERAENKRDKGAKKGGERKGEEDGAECGREAGRKIHKKILFLMAVPHSAPDKIADRTNLNIIAVEI